MHNFSECRFCVVFFLCSIRVERERMCVRQSIPVPVPMFALLYRTHQAKQFDLKQQFTSVQFSSAQNVMFFILLFSFYYYILFVSLSLSHSLRCALCAWKAIRSIPHSMVQWCIRAMLAPHLLPFFLFFPFRSFEFLSRIM